MPRKASESARYSLRSPGGSFVDGDWTHYDIASESGKSIVGAATKRSGGGWVATVPIYAKVDNGIADVRKQVGYARGYGSSAQLALDDAEREASKGPATDDGYAQEEMR